jgi:hypothetical protein
VQKCAESARQARSVCTSIKAVRKSYARGRNSEMKSSIPSMNGRRSRSEVTVGGAVHEHGFSCYVGSGRESFRHVTAELCEFVGAECYGAQCADARHGRRPPGGKSRGGNLSRLWSRTLRGVVPARCEDGLTGGCRRREPVPYKVRTSGGCGPAHSSCVGVQGHAAGAAGREVNSRGAGAASGHHPTRPGRASALCARVRAIASRANGKPGCAMHAASLRRRNTTSCTSPWSILENGRGEAVAAAALGDTVRPAGAAVAGIPRLRAIFPGVCRVLPLHHALGGAVGRAWAMRQQGANAAMVTTATERTWRD